MQTNPKGFGTPPYFRARISDERELIDSFGHPPTLTYPSNKVITYTISDAERLTAAKDVANNVQFATAASYAPPGQLQGLITGQVSGGFGGISESHSFNNRLEYTSTQATSSAGTALNLSLAYAISGGNNGSVSTVTNNVDNGRTVTAAYDPLNRVSSATTQATSGADCWGQSFIPDPLANLNTINVTQCSAGSLSVSVDGNNHITNTSFLYDTAGNMTQDGPSGFSYTFDAEDRLTKASGMTGGPYCYVYDGYGLRVAKKSGANADCTGGTVVKLYWRSITGDALAETDATGSTTNAAYVEYVFFTGRRVASRNGLGAIFYYFADHLGTTRTITTGSGSGQTPGQLCYDADFTPYGQEFSHTERLQTTACPPSYKFTGYESDPETGNYYAFARYYSPRLGRFLSIDPLGGEIGSLQSHNAYAYTVNDPLNMIDPVGLSGCPNNPNIPPGTTCGPPPNVPYGGVCGGSPTCDPVGAGWGGQECSIDGAPAPCSMAIGLLSGDAAARCPNDDCSGIWALQGNTFIGQIYSATAAIGALCEGTFANPTQSCGITSYPRGWSLGPVGQVEDPVGLDLWHLDRPYFGNATKFVNTATAFTAAGVTTVVAAPVIAEVALAPAVPLEGEAEKVAVCTVTGVGAATLATGLESLILDQFGSSLSETAHTKVEKASLLGHTVAAVAACLH